MTTHRRTHDDGHSEALSYSRLEQPWRGWARLARNFSYQVDGQDREDLMHDIIVRLAEVAEEYRQKGKPLTKGGCIRVAQYTRLRFYHQRKRWRRVFTVSLNSTVKDDDGNETQFINTLVEQKGIDLDAWIDAMSHYLSSPEKVKQAIRKLLNNGDGDGHRLSGYDWRLIREFREKFKEKALV
jgi:DNA-directed RNA polymerase specialized sigma24 family protein